MNKEYQIELEPSTNTHVLKTSEKTEILSQDGSTMFFKTNSNGQVVHGEHNEIILDKGYHAKYIQREKNPLTGKFQEAFD